MKVRLAMDCTLTNRKFGDIISGMQATSSSGYAIARFQALAALITCRRPLKLSALRRKWHCRFVIYRISFLVLVYTLCTQLYNIACIAISVVEALKLDQDVNDEIAMTLC